MQWICAVWRCSSNRALPDTYPRWAPCLLGPLPKKTNTVMMSSAAVDLGSAPCRPPQLNQSEAGAMASLVSPLEQSARAVVPTVRGGPVHFLAPQTVDQRCCDSPTIVPTVSMNADSSLQCLMQLFVLHSFLLCWQPLVLIILRREQVQFLLECDDCAPANAKAPAAKLQGSQFPCTGQR